MFVLVLGLFFFYGGQVLETFKPTLRRKERKKKSPPTLNPQRNRNCMHIKNQNCVLSFTAPSGELKKTFCPHRWYSIGLWKANISEHGTQSVSQEGCLENFSLQGLPGDSWHLVPTQTEVSLVDNFHRIPDGEQTVHQPKQVTCTVTIFQYSSHSNGGQWHFQICPAPWWG